MKPIEKLSIDFKLLQEENKEGKNFPNRYRLYAVDNRHQLVPFLGTAQHPFDGYLYLTSPDDQLFIESDPHGKIVECTYALSNNTFKPMRYRHDREEPNSLQVCLNTYIGYFNENLRLEKQLRKYFGVGEGEVVVPSMDILHISK